MAPPVNKMTALANALSRNRTATVMPQPILHRIANKRKPPEPGSSVYSKSRRIHNRYQKGLLFSVEASKCRSTG